jgi:hypothetical protein
MVVPYLPSPEGSALAQTGRQTTPPSGPVRAQARVRAELEKRGGKEKLTLDKEV